VDSSSTSALLMSGGVIGVSGGNSMYVHGNKQTSGGTITFTGGGSLQLNQPAHGDPMSGLTAPTAGTATSLSYSTRSATIPSGTYTTITISGGGPFPLSGTYIFTGSGLSVSGGSVVTAAAGATLYFPPTSSGTVSVSGGTLTLNAPTSGSLQGMAIWKDTTT